MNTRIAALTLLVLSGLAACQPAAPTPDAASTPLPTSTATPEEQPAEATDVPIVEPTPTPDLPAADPASIDVFMDGALPTRGVRRLGRGILYSAAVSPDGSVIAVGSSIGIYIFDSTTLEELRLIQTSSPVVSIAYSTVGSQILVGLLRGDLVIYEVRSGSQLDSWKVPGEGITLIEAAWNPEERIAHVIYTQDEKNFASTFSTDTKRPLDTTEIANPETQLPIEEVVPRVTQFEGFGAVEAGDFVWARNANSLLFTLNGEQVVLNVTSWQFTSVEDFVGYPPTTYQLDGPPYSVVDTASGETLSTLPHEGDADLAAWSIDGLYVAIANSEEINVYDVAEGRRVGAVAAAANSIEFAPDNDFIAVADPSGIVFIYDWRTKRSVRSLVGHTAPVTQMAWSPDNRLLATTSEDGTVVFWSVP